MNDRRSSGNRTEAAELGRRAEQFAFDYAASLGWQMLGRNIRAGSCEIDIAAIDGDELVIAEVRCRRVGRVQSAAESVGPSKIAKLIRAGTYFAERIEWTGPWRIDVIAVTAGTRFRAEHIKDATGGRYHQP